MPARSLLAIAERAEDPDIDLSCIFQALDFDEGFRGGMAFKQWLKIGLSPLCACFRRFENCTCLPMYWLFSLTDSTCPPPDVDIDTLNSDTGMWATQVLPRLAAISKISKNCDSLTRIPRDQHSPRPIA